MKFDEIAAIPVEPEYLVRQAKELAMSGDHTGAINFLKSAIQKNPRYTEAYNLLGNCQECLGQTDAAIESYDKALQLDANLADAWFNKGMILKKTGKSTESLQCIQKSVDLYCGA